MISDFRNFFFFFIFSYPPLSSLLLPLLQQLHCYSGLAGKIREELMLILAPAVLRGQLVPVGWLTSWHLCWYTGQPATDFTLQISLHDWSFTLIGLHCALMYTFVRYLVDYRHGIHQLSAIFSSSLPFNCITTVNILLNSQSQTVLFQ